MKKIYTIYNPDDFKHSKGKYTDKHVYRWEEHVSRNVSRPYCTCVIRSKLPGWWGKIELFRETDVFYTDLSVAIIKNIDHLVEYPEKFTALRDFVNKNKLNSKVMGWKGDYSYVYENFDRSIMGRYTTANYWGDQDFIDHCIQDKQYFQDNFPNQIISYKLGDVTDTTCIIGFHGKPKPEETEYWL